ncbi:Alpha-xylosidase [Fulvia fulva]|nr:Alpha-xylosidase [Fulvia fulva]
MRLLGTLATSWTLVLSHTQAHPGSHKAHNDNITVTWSTDPQVACQVAHGSNTVYNSAIMVGDTNVTTRPLQLSELHSKESNITVETKRISANVIRVQVEARSGYIGAEFTLTSGSHTYGVWSYPWNSSLSNEGVQFPLAGIGFIEGINWCNARAPFFMTSDGYAVYIDTLSMGYFDFSRPDIASFVFSTRSLTYYIILPAEEHDYKSILKTYAGLSNTAELPPDSAYGPVFWSDDFEQDFHPGVTNAQENYFDVIDHLQALQIHASGTFADRPYGTGNMSFGNFDFDPVYYPSPKDFIANLTSSGFDFQVWVANRAFVDTRLYNASIANGWLFPSINPNDIAGVALNLSIPEAYAYFKDQLSVFPALGVKGSRLIVAKREKCQSMSRISR